MKIVHSNYMSGEECYMQFDEKVRLMGPDRAVTDFLAKVAQGEFMGSIRNNTSYVDAQVLAVRKIAELGPDGRYNNVLKQIGIANTNPYVLDEIVDVIASSHVPERFELVADIATGSNIVWHRRVNAAEKIGIANDKGQHNTLLQKIANTTDHPYGRQQILQYLN